MLLRRSAGRPLHCKLTPFSSESAFFAASPSAILFIGDPEAAPISRSTVMRSLYRLTPAESQLADLLLTGDTVASAADRRGITEDSARTQLKSIFHKTDTKRQTDLIRLMLSVPV
jgi:DNA-binding CsgD family transcriptional regulator